MRRSYDSLADRGGSQTTCLSLDRGNQEIRLRALSLFLTPKIPSICRYRELANSLIPFCKFKALGIYDSRGLNSVSFKDSFATLYLPFWIIVPVSRFPRLKR